MISHFILYVQDQTRSTAFYTDVLQLEPQLNVPGMTEFQLAPDCVLGLMPEAGIKKLLPKMPDPASCRTAPRAELYLVVANPGDYYQRALQCGASPLSELTERDWGHRAGYCLDLDGHVIAFAEPID